jgi:beta-aspartyl-peptidase (threonine type)
LAVHGGAGDIRPRSEEEEGVYRQGLIEALEAGFAVLRTGGDSLEAVTVAVQSLEDCPLFNAGRGSVFTRAGTHEMDASVMDGRTRTAGAVAGVSSLRNPVRAARLVMEQSPYVLLIGRAAEDFAAEHGLELADPAWFFTPERHVQLLVAQEVGQPLLDHDGETDEKGGSGGFGTVGAVACDVHGNLAAATSTGGMTNKREGRVGDSAVIGAGTYADNSSVAVSATGIGEYFIRSVAAHDVSARMHYLDLPLEEACRQTLECELAPLGGQGGLIAVDALGNVAMPFNTAGMYRGVIRAAGEARVWVFR